MPRAGTLRQVTRVVELGCAVVVFAARARRVSAPGGYDHIPDDIAWLVSA